MNILLANRIAKPLAAFCVASVTVLVATSSQAERYTPPAFCNLAGNNSYESIVQPLGLAGDYPSGSTQNWAVEIADFDQPGGATGVNGDTYFALVFIDSDNDGTLEQLSNNTCTWAGGPTGGCTVTEPVVIPTVTEDTTFRIRAMISWNNPNPTTGCGNIVWGDFEDFEIVSDVQETITVEDVSGPEAGGAITLTATLSTNVRDAGGFAPFTVDYVFSDGSATTAGGDYAATTGTLTFNGQAGNQQTFTITPIADGIGEGNETVNVSFLNLSNTTHGIDITDTAVVTFEEDEVALTVAKMVSDQTPNIGDTVTFTLEVSNAGPDAAVNASVQDIVPAGFNALAVGAVPAGSAMAITGNTVDWTGIDVPVGGTVTATFTAVVLAP